MELIDRIFYAGIEEFKDRGVKFTMDSLAARLGISKRTLYETVASKHDVVQLVIERTFKDIKRQQKDIFENETMSLVDKIKSLFTIIPSYADHLDYRRIGEIKKAYPSLYQVVEDNINSDWDRSIALLQEAMDAGILRKKNLTVLRVILSDIYVKLLDGQFLIQNHITYEEAMKEYISIIFDGLLEDGQR